MIKPKIISVVACENFMKGADGRVSLLGLLRKFSTDSLPVTLSNVYVYLNLGFGEGRMDLSMRIIDPSGDVHYSLPEPYEIYFDNPSETSEIVINIPNITFKLSGTYILEFLINDELLSADFQFEVLQT